LLYGAALAGSVLEVAGAALHHELCHVLAGALDLPHAETHAVVLPYAAAYNLSAAMSDQRRLARALRLDRLPEGLFDLARALDAPSSLAALGLRTPELERAATALLAAPPANPVPITRTGVESLLHAAYEGRRPSGWDPAPDQAATGGERR